MSRGSGHTVVLCGGVGGARFLRALREENRRSGALGRVSAIVNTADDFWFHGLRVCPDLDSVLFTLAGVGDAERGWGRAGDSAAVIAELARWEPGADWFQLGDLDVATSLFRTGLLRAGLPLAAVTARLSERWPLEVRVLPATEQRLETRVRLGPHVPGRRRELGFQEWWVRHGAAEEVSGVPVSGFRVSGAAAARPAPGVLAALSRADRIFLAPSNPIVSIGPILAVPGIAAALRRSRAPIVGLSPLIAGLPIRGRADRCLRIAGLRSSALAVAEHYGARGSGGLLDGWLLDREDRGAIGPLAALGVRAEAGSIRFGGAEENRAIVRGMLALAAGPRQEVR